MEETEQGIKQKLRKSGANDQTVDQLLRKKLTENPSKVSSKKPSQESSKETRKDLLDKTSKELVKNLGKGPR